MAAFENSDNDVTWYIAKDGGEEKLYINYCTGSLRKAGGQISFKTSGTYRLIAGTTDNAGQIHKFSTDITSLSETESYYITFKTYALKTVNTVQVIPLKNG